MMAAAAAVALPVSWSGWWVGMGWLGFAMCDGSRWMRWMMRTLLVVGYRSQAVAGAAAHLPNHSSIKQTPAIDSIPIWIDASLQRQIGKWDAISNPSSFMAHERTPAPARASSLPRLRRTRERALLLAPWVCHARVAFKTRRRHARVDRPPAVPSTPSHRSCIGTFSISKDWAWFLNRLIGTGPCRFDSRVCLCRAVVGVGERAGRRKRTCSKQEHSPRPYPAQPHKTHQPHRQSKPCADRGSRPPCCC